MMVAQLLNRVCRKLSTGYLRTHLYVQFAACPSSISRRYRMPQTALGPSLRFFGTRRRRRGGDETSTGNSNEISTRPQKISMNSEEFGLKGEDVVEQLERSVEHLRDCNDTFEITRTSRNYLEGAMLTINVGPPYGKFSISVDENDQEILFSSPVSGPKVYIWSIEKEEFVSIDDGHVFVGLFVRDLIRCCNGVPKGL